MKLVLIGPAYPFRGGVSHFTTLLYKNLVKNNSVVFISYSRGYPKLLFPGSHDPDESKKVIVARKVERIIDWADPFSWVKVARKIGRLKPDLVIFSWQMWGWSVPFTVISFLVRIRKIQTLFICHNISEHEGSWWKGMLARLMFFTGSYFVVHSQVDFEKLIGIISEDKLKKSFLPIFNSFNYQPIIKSKARQILGIKGKTILFFGHIRPYKGLIYLLHAMPEILKEINLTLIIAGEFWEKKEKYDQIIGDLKIAANVRMFDKYIPNEEVGLYFYAADLVVLPYVSATGTAVTKLAFEFGKPVVGTRVGDIPEMIDNQRRGLIVPPRNPKALAEAVTTCYQTNNLLSDLSKNIRDDRRFFSWSRYVRNLESFFQ